ncbi:YbjQ family protein [Methanoculleus sp. MH98A]|uniref:YbjQ family protein n=1 Tax=Methanoculleus sp. MH98A TaxID=1495314 RepID=UPI00049FBC7F|nr:YbjQ family protein [Methanoculleus sp. MH98A]KDE55326.1 hypothetical protein EI28_07775 [Methanoculleus sp. MH98A]
MILTTTEEVPGYAVGEILGVVSGNTVRAKNVGRDVMAGLKSLVGGELEEYTSMLADARTEAYNRMANAAHDLGADAVVNIRFATSQTMGGAAELLAYGTAVKLVPRK